MDVRQALECLHEAPQTAGSKGSLRKPTLLTLDSYVQETTEKCAVLPSFLKIPAVWSRVNSLLLQLQCPLGAQWKS